MKNVLYITLAIAALSLAVMFWRVGDAVDVALKTEGARLNETVERVTVRESGLWRSEVLATVSRESTAYRAELRAARIDAARIADTQADAYRAEFSGVLDAKLARMTASVERVAGIRDDIQPTIAGANLLMRRDALPAQLLGTLGATKVTMGRVAKMSIAVEREVPAITESVKGTAGALERTAESTEQTADNIRKMTSPSLTGTAVRFAAEAVKTWGVWR